jgi:hypothetical protein
VVTGGDSGIGWLIDSFLEERSYLELKRRGRPEEVASVIVATI